MNENIYRDLNCILDFEMNLELGLREKKIRF